MALPSVFNSQTTTEIVTRLEKLNYQTTPQWGKMNVAQMLAHLNVAYDLAYGKTISNPNLFTKLILRLFVKKFVVNENPYPKNSRTAPEFIITNERDFDKEKAILIAYVKQTENHGSAYFEGKVSGAFGKLTAQEWSNQFYKHINHHFTQFGV